MSKEEKVQYWLRSADKDWKVAGHLFEKGDKRMDKRANSIIKVAKEYVKELERNNIPIEEAIIFGSYVKGKPKEESDIDIALISTAFTGDRFDDSIRIIPLRRKIDSRIEPIPFRPEDFDRGGVLVDEIKRTGKIIINRK